MPTFLIIDLIILLLPISFSFTHKLAFYKDLFFVLPAIIISMAVFILWDHFFTIWGVWGYHSAHYLGIYWMGLPIEQLLFYFALSYFSLFVYAFTKVYITPEVLKHFNKFISSIILLVALVLFFSYRKQLYTSISSLLCVFLLTYRTWIAKPKSLARFYLAFIICLIPVLVIYAILTSFAITWYDLKYITGIRISAIPIENILFFLSLFLMNVGIYDYLKYWKTVETPLEIIPEKELENKD